jgi:hypothetical protein
MQPSCLPIAPISLPSGPFYRPITIMLYNTCHLFSHCEKHLRGILVTSQTLYSHTLQTITLHLACPRVCHCGNPFLVCLCALREQHVDCFPGDHVPLLSTTLLRVPSLFTLDSISWRLFSCVFVRRPCPLRVKILSFARPFVCRPLLRKMKISSFAWSSLVDPRSFPEIGTTKAHTILDLLR